MTSVLLRRADVSLWMTTRYGQLQLDFGLGRISARNPHQMLVLTLVIGLGMGFVSFIYLKNQMRPMQRLARAAEAFGRRQTLPYRPAGATEVRAAGAAFLEMRERIERHIEQRTLLLSGISHDLRTPPTRMRLALSMFDDEPEAQALLADVAEMEALIDRFLDFTRSEAEEPVSPTDLGALVAQRVHEAARLGRSVDLIGAPEGPILPPRPQLLARAVDNLIGNALRYGRKARVSVTSAQGWAIISVEDDGPGIEPQHYDRAIRPFVRLDPARVCLTRGRGRAGPCYRRGRDAQSWRKAGSGAGRDAGLWRVACAADAAGGAASEGRRAAPIEGAARRWAAAQTRPGGFSILPDSSWRIFGA
ncbi:ATP-binding protein [Novosphingobium sp. MW5]|nr:ATP-binding protein [Novosphingobium sp. MW5]